MEQYDFIFIDALHEEEFDLLTLILIILKKNLHLQNLLFPASYYITVILLYIPSQYTKESKSYNTKKRSVLEKIFKTLLGEEKAKHVFVLFSR